MIKFFDNNCVYLLKKSNRIILLTNVELYYEADTNEMFWMCTFDNGVDRFKKTLLTTSNLKQVEFIGEL